MTGTQSARAKGREYGPAPGIEDVIDEGESVLFIGDAGGIFNHFCVGVLLGYFGGQRVWAFRAGASFEREKELTSLVL